MRYIVTGTDGQLGSRVASNMLKAVEGKNLIFTCVNLRRIPAHVLEQWIKQGVEVKEANYDNKKQMIKVFTGSDRLFVVSSIINGPKRIQQHKNVIDAAIAAGVQHLTYTSFLGADREGYNQYVLPDHTATEQYLRDSGIEYNVMRNNLYMENYLINSLLLANISDNKWITPAGDGKASFIAKDDSGRVGAALLMGKGELNTAYDVTGGELISEKEICAMIAAVSGIPYTYYGVSPADFFEYLDSLHISKTTDGDFSQSPVPFCGNDMVTNEFSIRDGLMAVQSDAVQMLTGRKPLRAEDLLETYSFVWKERVSTYWDLSKFLYR